MRRWFGRRSRYRVFRTPGGPIHTWIVPIPRPRRRWWDRRVLEHRSHVHLAPFTPEQIQHLTKEPPRA